MRLMTYHSAIFRRKYRFQFCGSYKRLSRLKYVVLKVILKSAIFKIVEREKWDRIQVLTSIGQELCVPHARVTTSVAELKNDL